MGGNVPNQGYKLRAFIQSFTRLNKKYAIKKNDNGELVCSCPDYIYRRKNQKLPEDRLCKHLEKLNQCDDKLAKLFLYIAGDKFVLEIDGDRWEVSQDMTPEGPVIKEEEVK
jgi:hypothetical protein